MGIHADTTADEWMTGGGSAGDSDVASGLTGPLDASALAEFAPGTTSTTTSGMSDYGFIEVITRTMGTYASTAGRLMAAQAVAHGSFREDSVVVNAPGYGPGQFGTFVAEFEISHIVDFMVMINSVNGGTLDITGAFQLEVNIGDAHPGPYGGVPWTYSSTSGSTSPVVPSGPISVPVNFEYGVPFTISADLEINLSTFLFGDINADVDALMNLGSAFFWKGIDTEGLPEGTTVSSDHVEDWTEPYVIVPAPATMSLLPLASAAVLRRRRRGH